MIQTNKLLAADSILRRRKVSIIEGDLYARPLSEEDWRTIQDMIDPYFLGLIIGSVSQTQKPLTAGINIGNHADITQNRVYENWRKQGRPYTGIGFFWDDRERCRPPLSVAESADQIAGAMEAGDRDVMLLIDWAAYRLNWEPEEAAADCIQAMRDLAKACRLVAEKGATEVTVILES